MSRPQPTSFVEENLLADSNAGSRLRLVGPWMLLYGGTKLATGLDLQAVDPDYEVQVGWRTATTGTDVPNAWQTLLTARTAAGNFSEEVTFGSGVSDGAMWVQASLWTKLDASATTPATALNRLWYSVKGAGWIVARQRVNLTASSTGDIIPIGAPFNCVGVTGLMFAVVYTNLAATITPTAVVRTFKSGNLRRPEAWSTVAAMSTQSGSTDSTRDTKQGSVSTTDRMMAQAGFKWTTSGATPGGVAEIIVAAKTT